MSKAPKKHKDTESASSAGEHGSLRSRAIRSARKRGTRCGPRLPECACVNARFSHTAHRVWALVTSHTCLVSKQQLMRNPPTTQTVHAYTQRLISGRPEVPFPRLAGLPTSAGWNRKLYCPDRRSASASVAQAQWSSDGVVGGEKEKAEGAGPVPEDGGGGGELGYPGEAPVTWC